MKQKDTLDHPMASNLAVADSLVAFYPALRRHQGIARCMEAGAWLGILGMLTTMGFLGVLIADAPLDLMLSLSLFGVLAGFIGFGPGLALAALTLHVARQGSTSGACFLATLTGMMGSMALIFFGLPLGAAILKFGLAGLGVSTFSMVGVMAWALWADSRTRLC